MLRKIALVFMSVIFGAFFFVILSTKERVDMEPSVIIPENHLLVEDLYMIHAMAGEKGYATLHAENAYINNNTETLTLLNPSLTLKDSENDLVTRADRGLFIMNEKLTTRGNVNGTWNEIAYTVDPAGAFVFDFQADTGVAGDNVTATTKTGSFVRAGQLNYDGPSNIVTFTGGVEMFMAEEL